TTGSISTPHAAAGAPFILLDPIRRPSPAGCNPAPLVAVPPAPVPQFPDPGPRLCSSFIVHHSSFPCVIPCLFSAFLCSLCFLCVPAFERAISLPARAKAHKSPPPCPPHKSSRGTRPLSSGG